MKSTRAARVSQSIGFTLVETLVAMAIMTGAVLIVANAWSGNFARIKNARVNNTVAQLLERKMIETEIKYKSKPSTDVPEEDGGDFGPMFPGYTWQLKSQPFEMPDMSSSMIAKEGGADEMLLTLVRTVSDFIKDAVKEVSVTVIFKAKNGNVVRHSVATYFVDYTKEIAIPGFGGTGAAGGAAGGGVGTGTTSAAGGK